MIIRGTTGRAIELDTKIDLTPFGGPGATVQYLVQRPDRSVTVWAASFKDSNPSNGVLTHTLETGDVDQDGDYLLHANVDDGEGQNLIGELYVLRVLDLYTRKNG